MKFMLLVRVLHGAEPTSEEADPSAWIADGTRRGMWLEGHRLREVTDATTVRLREGKTIITDGPFAEVAEHIAGFDVIEAACIEDAAALAERHPMARYGAIEVREVWEEFDHAEDSSRKLGAVPADTDSRG